MFGILFDGTRCTGCERCVEACVEENDLDPVAAARDRATTRDGLSANRLLSLLPLADGRFARNGYVYRLPLLHAGLPLPRSALRVAGGAALREEVLDVLRSTARRRNAGLRGGLSLGRAAVR